MRGSQESWLSGGDAIANPAAPGRCRAARNCALLDHPVRPAIAAAAGPGRHDLPAGVLTPATLEEALTIALAISA